MWYPWIALLLCALAAGAAGQDVGEKEIARVREAVATRPPPRTLDRKADELAWHSWLQGPENDSQNATHRRITTKSLFITPLNCPKGQRLDRNGCVTVLNVNKEEHERILLDQLNSYFTANPSNGGDGDLYDYGDEEQGPLQLTIPIGQEPQAELSAQAQNQQPTFVQFDKKGDGSQNDGSIEAELELLKLQQAAAKLNRTGPSPGNSLSHGALNNLLSYSDKPKRDSPLINETESLIANVTDKGQEEKIFGHVNVDPLAYGVHNQNQEVTLQENKNNKTETPVAEQLVAMTNNTESQTNNTQETIPNTTMQSLKAAPEEIKLRPEIEYSDIDEAIKLISRFADVSTDDNFANNERKPDLPIDDSVLGTRTKLQYRRNKPKIVISDTKESPIETSELSKAEVNLNSADILRYPWPNASPPPDYPFRRLQDYWPGRTQVGGVYNTHENPRRHHHSYPHYFHPRPYPYTALSEPQRESFPRLRRFPHKLSERMDTPTRSHGNNQDLYSLLGLRHWFGSEGASKR